MQFSLGGLLKIEHVLAELRKERNKIDKAIAALERLARDSVMKRSKQPTRGRQKSHKRLSTSAFEREQQKSANIIQFPGRLRKVSSNRSGCTG
jgi:hypothetical protein